MTEFFAALGSWLATVAGITLPWGLTFGQTIAFGAVLPLTIRVLISFVGDYNSGGE